MLTATVRRRVAVLRQPALAIRIARALWIAWAVVVWNVVFDRVIVVAGRRYVVAAELAANATGPVARAYVSAGEWMRPAVSRGLWIATASATLILLVGLLSVRAAGARST
jgi:hypothetical protein